jgi:hypothetical protein
MPRSPRGRIWAWNRDDGGGSGSVFVGPAELSPPQGLRKGQESLGIRGGSGRFAAQMIDEGQHLRHRHI